MAIEHTNLGKIAQSTQLSRPQKVLGLVMALGAMALLRGADPNPKTIELYAERVLEYPETDVLAVIQRLGDDPMGAHEKAFPDFGTIRLMVEERQHPLRHLRSLVRALAENFGERPTPLMFENFETICGHRTDEDLAKAYRQIMRSDVKRMPTAGQFLAACGILTINRDGSKP